MLRCVLIPSVLLSGLLAVGLAAAEPRALSEAASMILAKREAEEATRRSARFGREAERATSEAARARAQAEAVAARIQAAEAGITAAEARIRIIEGRRARQRARLAERQAPLVRLTAALQSQARRPPALALVQPGSVEDLIRTRSLLATTMPVIRARTAEIRSEIARGEQLRSEAAAALAALVQSQEELRRQRAELARLETQQRQRSQSLTETALTESDRALAFGEEARDIGARLGSRQMEARMARMLAGLPGPVLRPVTPAGPARPEPGLPDYRLPVDGTLLAGTGEISDAGVHARGLTFEAPGASQVVAPSGGRVAYAGRFRGYGEIVIIEHGSGWASLVTNLAKRTVNSGDTVEAGTPLGRTGAGRSRVSVELRLNGRPVPIAPMLR